MKKKKPGGEIVAPSSLRFLIADDQPIVRSGLRKTLHDRFREATFEFATNADEAIAAGRADSFDVILFELATPGGHGLQTLAQLHQISPRTPILIVTVQDEESPALLALAAGAAGFISKSAPMPALISAVERVLRGQAYLSEELTWQISLRLQKSHRTRLQKIFSPLELEVFEQMAAGCTARQISDKLARRARAEMADGLTKRDAA